MPDDIPVDITTSETERPIPPENRPPRRKVGPESEVRGGPEAVDDSPEDLTDGRGHGPG